MVTTQSGGKIGKQRNARGRKPPYTRKEPREFKCYGCGKIGHARKDCRYNPENKEGICYKGTPPPWVLEWQKGPEGAKWNKTNEKSIVKSEDPEKEDESN
jgi:hypothetical protein